MNQWIWWANTISFISLDGLSDIIENWQLEYGFNDHDKEFQLETVFILTVDSLLLLY